MSKHPGFENVATNIAMKERIPIGEARRILAARSRSASPAAKKANPRLKKVKG